LGTGLAEEVPGHHILYPVGIERGGFLYALYRRVLPYPGAGGRLCRFGEPRRHDTAGLDCLRGGGGSAIFLNFIALMCSHVAAFTTLYALKLDFTRHIAALPLGFHTENSTGKLRKVVDENIEKLEGFIAHQLPDLAGSFAMPVITLAILFVFDWRLGLASLVPVITSYLIQVIAFGSKNAQVFVNRYQNSLEDMNNAAVEYVRGISVVKACNQTIYSFRKFYDIIKTYGKFVSGYTMSCEIFMELFMLIINHVYLFLIPVIILISGGTADYGAFALASVFYLVFSVSLSTVRGADKIVVIDRGRLAEGGTHEELARAGRRYSRMWERYTGTMNWSLAKGGLLF
jgi:ABC-type multidrug transport system fused ATPase/permease subunit